MSTTQRTLELDFTTELNRIQRLRIYDARQEVAAAMDDIVNKNVFTSNSGSLTGKSAARMITKNVEEIELT